MYVKFGQVIKTRIMSSAGHVTRMGDNRGADKVFVGGDLSERDHLVDLGVEGTYIFKWIFNKRDGDEWTRFDLAQNRDRWRPLVKAVMNIRFY
jgi:hypothetical protein